MKRGFLSIVSIMLIASAGVAVVILSRGASYNQLSTQHYLYEQATLYATSDLQIAHKAVQNTKKQGLSLPHTFAIEHDHFRSEVWVEYYLEGRYCTIEVKTVSLFLRSTVAVQRKATYVLD